MNLRSVLSGPKLTLLAFSIVKIIVGFALYKWVSINNGVESLAVLGQALSLGALLTFLATGGMSRGVIHYLSKYKRDKQRAYCVIKSARQMLVFSSAISAALLWYFADYISYSLVGSELLTQYVKLLALSAIILGFNNLSLAFCAVEERQRQAMLATGSAMIIALLVITTLESQLSFPIYYYFPVIQGVVVFCFLVLLVRKTLVPYYLPEKIPGQICKSELRGLLRHSGVLVTSICISNLMNIYMRKEIIGSMGMESAGIWEVAQKISEGYMQFFGLVLVYYVFQKMSAENENRVRHLIETIGLFVFVLILFFLFMFFKGEGVIGVLFSPEWAGQSNQITLKIIVGDIFRIVFVALQYYYLSLDRIRLFVVLEALWGGVLLSVFSYYPSGLDISEYATAYIISFSASVFVSILVFNMTRAEK